MENRVCPLSEASEKEVFGGKAVNLCRLINLGYEVPAGFCLGVDSVEEAARSNLDLGTPLRQEIQTIWTSGLKEHGVAVRSSATVEDGVKISWAGQFTTELFIDSLDGLVSAIRSLIEGLKNENISYYQSATKSTGKPRLAIILQEMIEPRASGVTFTTNPNNGDENQMLIQSCFGVADPLVNGRITGDILVVNREGDILDKSVNPKPFKITRSGREELTDDIACSLSLRRKEIKKVAETSGQIADDFSRPQDIEWCIDVEGELNILQTRPITCL